MTTGASSRAREPEISIVMAVRRATRLWRLGGYAEGYFPAGYELRLRLHHAGCRTAKLPQVLPARWESEGRGSRTSRRTARESIVAALEGWGYRIGRDHLAAE
jgi:hypothetical protein